MGMGRGREGWGSLGGGKGWAKVGMRRLITWEEFIGHRSAECQMQIGPRRFELGTSEGGAERGSF